MAVELVKSLKTDLLRDALFDEVWEQTSALSTKFDIAEPLERRRRRCRGNANQRVWVKADYRTRLFDRIITVFLGELNRRFSGEVCEVLNSMSALFPQSEGFLDVSTTTYDMGY